MTLFSTRSAPVVVTTALPPATMPVPDVEELPPIVSAPVLSISVSPVVEVASSALTCVVTRVVDDDPIPTCAVSTAFSATMSVTPAPAPFRMLPASSVRYTEPPASVMLAMVTSPVVSSI
jgi:hypothetical protein